MQQVASTLLQVDPTGRRAWVGGAPVKFGKRRNQAFDLLCYLWEHRVEPRHIDEILKALWLGDETRTHQDFHHVRGRLLDLLDTAAGQHGIEWLVVRLGTYQLNPDIVREDVAPERARDAVAPIPVNPREADTQHGQGEGDLSSSSRLAVSGLSVVTPERARAVLSARMGPDVERVEVNAFRLDFMRSVVISALNAGPIVRVVLPDAASPHQRDDEVEANLHVIARTSRHKIELRRYNGVPAVRSILLYEQTGLPVLLALGWYTSLDPNAFFTEEHPVPMLVVEPHFRGFPNLVSFAQAWFHELWDAGHE